MNAVHTNAGFAGARSCNDGDVAAAHAVAGNAASATRSATIPARHRCNAGQAARQARLPDQHLHAKGERLNAGILGQFVDKTFHKKAIVTVC